MKKALFAATIFAVIILSSFTLVACEEAFTEKSNDENIGLLFDVGLEGEEEKESPLPPPTPYYEVIEEYNVEAKESCTMTGYSPIRCELLEGSETCDDGVLVEYKCVGCEHGYTTIEKHRGHPEARVEIDIASLLEADGKSWHTSHYGYVKSCGCGEIKETSISMNNPLNETVNETVYTRCRSCDLYSVTELHYDEPDEKCNVTGYGEYKIYYGDILLGSSAKVKLGDRIRHDFNVAYSLAPGATSCLRGGVVATYDCMRCGEHYTDRPYNEVMHYGQEDWVDLEDYDVCYFHSIYHSVCVCETKDSVFSVGYGLRERPGENGLFVCSHDGCNLTVSLEHAHEKVTDVCDTEKCYKYTVRIGERIIYEYTCTRTTTLVNMTYDGNSR